MIVMILGFEDHGGYGGYGGCGLSSMYPTVTRSHAAGRRWRQAQGSM